MKNYQSGIDLINKFCSGIEKLNENVACTLGPGGHNVAINGNPLPIVTKDGVTIAKIVESDDPFENMAIQIVKQASLKTNQQTGDGTTTSIVIAAKIIQDLKKYLITSDISRSEICKGMNEALKQLETLVKNKSIQITSLKQVEDIARISANNDEAIGKLVANAIDVIGKNGSLVVKEGRSLETTLEVQEGFQFDGGYISTKFVNHEQDGSVRFEKANVLVTNKKFVNANDVLPILELIVRDKMPLIMVVDDMKDQALATVIMNSIRGNVKIVVIKAPRYGEERDELLKDVTISTDAKLVQEEQQIKLTDFGYVENAKITQNETILVNGRIDDAKFNDHLDSIQQKLEKLENEREIEKLQERLTRLSSGVATIYVGGNTEIEMIERKFRIEDAIMAVKVAQESGILPGGGISLLKTSCTLVPEVDIHDKMMGFLAVKNAVTEPFRRIILNKTDNLEKYHDILQKVLENENFEYGYDVKNDQYGNMFDLGIIDPTRVTLCALTNAISVATTLVTCGHAISE